MLEKRSPGSHRIPLSFKEPKDPAVLMRRNRRIIFLVMILIAVLMLLEKRRQQKSRIYPQVLQVEQSFQVVAGALERYEIDNKVLPLSSPGIYSTSGLWFLTTPHPYLRQWDILKDPFHEDYYQIAYFNRFPTQFILMSTGPDRRWDFTRLPSKEQMPPQTLQHLLETHRYDPSNGIRSGGDILGLKR